MDQDGRSESYLIRPADEWLDEAAGNPNWSQDSERVHGISLRTLLTEGLPYRQIALRVEEVLGARGQIVCSDAPYYDGMWLDRLLSAAGTRSHVRLVGVHELYRQTCRHVMHAHVDHEPDEATLRFLETRALSIINDARAAEADREGVRHRALPDAEALQHTWRAVADNFEDFVRSAN